MHTRVMRKPANKGEVLAYDSKPYENVEKQDIGAESGAGYASMFWPTIRPAVIHPSNPISDRSNRFVSSGSPLPDPGDNGEPSADNQLSWNTGIINDPWQFFTGKVAKVKAARPNAVRGKAGAYAYLNRRSEKTPYRFLDFELPDEDVAASLSFAPKHLAEAWRLREYQEDDI